MRSAWREQAACRNVSPELFFPTAESGPAYEAQVADAKAVCARCVVRPDCLVEAMARIPDGIAGGLTADERHQARITGRPGRPGRTSDAAVLATGLQSGARASEVRAAGWVLLAAGRPAREVAARCGVTLRTAERWATTSTTTTTTSRTSASSSAPAREGGAGKDRGASRALPLISHTHDAPAKDTNTERTRA